MLAIIQSPDVGQATAELGKAEADLIAANHDVARKRDLFDSHAASAADVETAEDNYRKALAEKARAFQRARLLHAAQADVKQGYALTSPIDGEIIARMVSPGVEVQGQYGGGSAVELFTVGELDKVWVLADVFEMNLAHVRVGDLASVHIVSYPGKTFDGTIDWISGVIDPVARTSKVRCVLDNPNRDLRPEMFATVQISLGVQRAPAIPRTAVLRLGSETAVLVEDSRTPDDRLRFRKVVVRVDENESGDWIRAPAELREGQVLATSNAILLSGLL